MKPHEYQLSTERPRIIYPSLAVALGVNAAVVVTQVKWWCSLNAKRGELVDGHAWTWNSYAQWQEEFPWISERTLRRIIKSLEAKEILVSRRRSSQDATKMYRVNEPVLLEAVSAWGGQDDQ